MSEFGLFDFPLCKRCRASRHVLAFRKPYTNNCKHSDYTSVDVNAAEVISKVYKLTSALILEP